MIYLFAEMFFPSEAIKIKDKTNKKNLSVHIQRPNPYKGNTAKKSAISSHHQQNFFTTLQTVPINDISAHVLTATRGSIGVTDGIS